MAFQPIVNFDTREVTAYEALARGPSGEPAAWVFERVHEGNLYGFDQACRRRAIGLAARLGMTARLHINFMPNAVYQPETCIRASLDACRESGFPPGLITFEVTEGERVIDRAHLCGIIRAYQNLGFRTAIDDFGAGYSGLNLLAEFQPDLLKLDMDLIRGVDADRARRAVVRGVIVTCEELSIDVIAEGVETAGEVSALRDLGVSLFQGYHFARPTFETLAGVSPEVFDGSGGMILSGQ